MVWDEPFGAKRQANDATGGWKRPGTGKAGSQGIKGSEPLKLVDQGVRALDQAAAHVTSRSATVRPHWGACRPDSESEWDALS